LIAKLKIQFSENKRRNFEEIKAIKLAPSLMEAKMG
jgi:hypothetical protein